MAIEKFLKVSGWDSTIVAELYDIDSDYGYQSFIRTALLLEIKRGAGDSPAKIALK